jgi:hypothetical protein
LDAGADPDSRWRSRPLGRAGDPSRRLQDSGQRMAKGIVKSKRVKGGLTVRSP